MNDAEEATKNKGNKQKAEDCFMDATL